MDDPVMGYGSEPKSRVTFWLRLIALLLLIYVLSVGPVTALFANGSIDWKHAPKATQLYSPLHWLSSRTHTDQWVHDYTHWWVLLLDKRGKQSPK